MHGNSADRRALEREALRNVINQWNANRLDLFELSEPNEDLEFHGVMRFYFQDSGQKVATKCIRVASDATVEDVIGTLVEKFRPDMRMLSVPSYALYELHEGCPERKMAPDEKPLLVQLNWHVDDREGRFLLKNVDDKTVNSMGLSDSNASFRRKLSKREKKALKKQEKKAALKNENGDVKDPSDGVAEKLYTELPETIFTRSISNPEAVMRRRRQQKLEKKLQQFRSKDGGPDTGGTLKIYGEALCREVPYKTLLLSVRDCAGAVVREMLDKYGLSRADPSQWCLVQVTQQPGGGSDAATEYVLDDDECPLSILMNAPNTSSIMFHVRRRPADCAPRKRKKKPGTLGAPQSGSASARNALDSASPFLVELTPDGTTPHPGDTASRTVRLPCVGGEVTEVGSANGIALQLYGPHIQPRHCVLAANHEGAILLTPCHPDAHTYVNGQRVYQTTVLQHGAVVRFGTAASNAYRFVDPKLAAGGRVGGVSDGGRIYDRSPRALSPVEPSSRENFETTFDLEGNVETVSTASGAREDNRSLGSCSENRLSGMDRYPRGQDPILPAVLEFPEEPQEQFLARVITHLDVTSPTFRLAPAYTLYLCARYRASTHYRPELTPTERAHKLTLLLQHAAALVRRAVQDGSSEAGVQAFWLANASELLHFLKSDRHVSAFSLQAQDTLADAVQLAFRNLVACLTDELSSMMPHLMSDTADDHPREIISVLSSAMNLLRKCRVNAALTIQLFSQLFHWISSRSLSAIINNPTLCTRAFGVKLFNRLRNLQAWAESQGLELAAECHLAKIVQCAHLLQAPKYTAEELANLSAACFKLNSLQLRALLTQYKAETGEQIAPPQLLEQAARAAESVADELARAEGRDVCLHEDPAPALQLLLPDDGFSCDVVQGVPPGLADFLHPLQASGLCRLAAQPTSSGHWTVYMSAPRPPSALSTTQPEIQTIRLHKAGGGMGLSIVAAKGAGQERLGIYIKSVVPGGAADRDGRLQAGDQLLSVDGQSLLGITQEKAAEFLVRTGSVVTLQVAKGGAVYHGLATLLQQPSPTPHRGPRRMSERDLPSRVDAERAQIPSSKSVPSLHHISPAALPDHHQQHHLQQQQHHLSRAAGHHDVFNPGYSRTSSSNSINTNGVNVQSQNGPTNTPSVAASALRSRSTHNLHQPQQQQDGGFYQNLSVYRNKMPSPQQQQLGDRTSVLRSSQNSLQSSVATGPQRPSSAYYPPQTSASNQPRSNLHQSIPNLKSPPVTQQRLQNEDVRSGSYPSVHQQSPYSPNYALGYLEKQNPNYVGQGYVGYPRQQEDSRQYGSSYGNSYLNPTQSYPNVHSVNGQRTQDLHYNPGGLLREDVFRQSQTGRQQEERVDTEALNSSNAYRREEVLRYPNTNNIRISEAQIQHSRPQQHESEVRTSKSDDLLRQYTHNGGEMLRYASSGNVRAQESNKVDIASLRHGDHERTQMLKEEARVANNMRGQAKLAEMGEEVARRQNRGYGSGPYQQQQQQPPQQLPYYQQQQQQQQYYSQHQPAYSNYPQHSTGQMTQSMQNLSLNQSYTPGTHHQSQKTTYVASKHPSSSTRKGEDPPEPPPTTTHPLYSASMQDPPKMAFYPAGVVPSKTQTPRDPWAREEQERQAEVRREQARQWREQQIAELMSIGHRTPQQEEQLRVLQLEREFQRRAMEEAEQDDDDTEKDSSTPVVASPTSGSPTSTNLPVAEAPASILKAAAATANTQPPPPEPAPPPPPPERGSSYAVMSLRSRDTSASAVSVNVTATKRVSFDTPTTLASSPSALQLDETTREDPNSFIRQAESMLASPTTPTVDSSGIPTTATPGVIGAQEVYRDPRARRLAEQAQQKTVQQTPVPEKLSFKEKMKMFAMETGETGTPRDKSKISKAQREIDNLSSPPNMVH